MSFIQDLGEFLGLDADSRADRREKRHERKLAKIDARTERKGDRADVRTERVKAGTDVGSIAKATVEAPGKLAGKALDVVGDNPEILGAVGAAIGGPAGAALGSLVGGGKSSSSQPVSHNTVVESKTPDWVLPVGIGAGVLTTGALVYAASRKK